MLNGFLEEIEGSETKRQLFPGKKARFIQQMANNKAGQLPQSGSISDCCPTGKQCRQGALLYSFLSS